jgi:hypothetical protein
VMLLAGGTTADATQQYGQKKKGCPARIQWFSGSVLLDVQLVEHLEGDV